MNESRKMTLIALALFLKACVVPQSLTAEAPFDYETAKDGFVYSFFLTPDGKTLLLGGNVAMARGGWTLWDMGTGKKRQAGSMEGRCSHALALSPDGKLLASGGNSTELKLFDPATGKVLAVLEGHRAGLQQVDFTPDGKYLLSAGNDNMLRVWKVADRSPAANYRFTSDNAVWNRWKSEPEQPHERAKVTVTFDKVVDKLQCFAISPDGKSLAVTTGTKEVKLLELLTGKQLKSFTTDHFDGALSVAFSPDGKALALGGGCDKGPKGTIEVWDVASGKRRLSLKGHEGSVLCLRFSPDGKTLLSGGLHDGARLWDLDIRKQKRHIPSTGEQRVLGVAFLPDSKTFLLARDMSPVQFYDLASGKLVSPIRTK